jgi:hypothetical protein
VADNRSCQKNYSKAKLVPPTGVEPVAYRD